jgi:predicted nicotinamide N-methyase
MLHSYCPLLLLALVGSYLSVSSALSTTNHDRAGASPFRLHLNQATVLTADGTVALPPMMSVPCSSTIIKEFIQPPSVDELYQWYVDTRDTPDADPSWGVLWSTAVSLSNYIVSMEQREEEVSSLVKDKRVVELGCGLGLCGLTAAALGAKSVLLSDREPFALHCALSTAAVNADSIIPNVVQAAVLDWTDEESAVIADIVLASDVLYDKETIEAFAGACRRMVSGGGMILVCDPLRERCAGARDLFCAAMGDDIKVELIDLPPIECDNVDMNESNVDAIDHARRMQEPTVLLKCCISPL